MPLTRLAAEDRLVRAQLGAIRAAAESGFSPAATGANPDLNWPIALALIAIGLPPPDPTTVTDADLAAVPPSRLAIFFDAAEVELLEALLGAVRIKVTEQVDQDRRDLSDIAKGLETTIARRRKDLASRLAAALAGPIGGIAVGNLAPDPVIPDAICRPWNGPLP